MYRPSAAARTARNFMHQAIAAGTNAVAFAADAMLGALIKAGIYEQAMRENRRRERTDKRGRRNSVYSESGLNGKRAVARRLRQIERGSLTAANGLVL